MINPFTITHYTGPAYFCDREDETDSLLKSIQHHRHTAFFSLRRLGKTSLVRHCFHIAEKQKIARCIYLDIYATNNLRDLGNALAGSIYTVFPEKKGIGRKFWEFIKSFRPVITMDELTGGPALSLDISQPSQVERSIPQILQFLDRQNQKTCIAIDEFQQILSYPEKNVEAILRTAMQQLKNVTLIFCGSNQVRMQEIFNNSRRPFYASCSSISLGKIETKKYHAFIRRHFKKGGFTITDEVIKLILEQTEGYTYYTQRLCHDLYTSDVKHIRPEAVSRALSEILKEQENNYYQYRNLLTKPQWHLLAAIAKEEKVTKPFGKDFSHRYDLGTPAMVKRSLEALLEKEMVYLDTAADPGYYAVYDKFLMRWLQSK